MNGKLFIVSCLVAAACGQFIEPKNAKILKEQRFNTGDGRFGSAFAQEDGVVFREETTIDGERIGQYSYVDLDGKTVTVKYTAGKDGFRIIEGDHVPIGANGLNSAPFDPEQAVASDAPAAPVAAVRQAVPVRQPAPVRQVAAPVRVQQPTPIAALPQSLDYDYVDEPVDPNFNPFINPHDPTHRNFQFNQNGANFGPRPTQLHSASAVPNCANCAGVNPFINPFDASHQQPQQFVPQVQQQQFVPQVQQPQQFVPQVQQQQFVPQQQQQPVFNQNFLQPVTEAPRNFFPPGQLQLNRFETGFNFDFSS